MHDFSLSSQRPRCTRGAVAALAALAALALGACGGGGDDSDPPNGGSGGSGGSGGTGPSVSISALEGDWVQKGCAKAGAQSFKRTARARITGQTTIDYFEGVLTFQGNDCAGAYQAVGPTKTGTVTFARSESNPALAAHWGELRTVIGTRAGAIWTLQPNHLLCLLGDEIPSIQPTLGAVASSVATVPADNCFTR